MPPAEGSMSMVQIAIAYHSGYGHTKVVAEEVAEGAGLVAGTAVSTIAVDKIDDAGWNTLDKADAIIFGAPTYVGSPSGPFKVFPDPTPNPSITPPSPPNPSPR